MTTFSGLQIGLSSLLAQRRAIEVAGQNLANVNTEGYSRQRVALASDSGPITPAIFSRYEGSGLGVRSGVVERLRDQFLELRGYQEHAAGSRLEVEASVLARVEGTFGEPSDTGIAAQLADFWAGWDDVANRPDDLAARSQLLERAETLSASFRRADAELAALWDTTLEQTSAVVAEVNGIAARVAELNATIQAAVGSGLTPNDLMDQRDALISQLSERVGVTVRPGDAGTTDVFVGGTALVRGTRSESLEVLVGPGPAQVVSVNWTKDGSAASTSGQIGGMLDALDDVLPRYRASLGAVAGEVLTATNAVHGTGFDLDGVAGVPFFTMGPGGLEVSAALAGDPRKVAASAASGTIDGSIAAAIAATSGPDGTYRQLIVGLGVEAQSANRRVDIQAAITREVDAARESEAGVNIDEEMTQLMAFQHAYQAAARFVSVVDETLDALMRL
jgi:flagellar hook-associated protein 1 FlgK